MGASSAVRRNKIAITSRWRYVAYKTDIIVTTMPPSGPRGQRGFTLIELLVTITVLVILSSIAAVSYSTSVNNNRLYASQNEFVAYLALARSEAVRRGLPVILSAAAPTGGNAFGGGWTVWVDSNSSGSFDTGEPVLRTHDALPSTILIGDGMLNYRRERVLESYYALALNKAFTLTADYQLITNPAYNADRGPVHIFSGRLHGEF